MKKYNLSTTLGRFLFVGLLEGISFLLLLGIAMPLKYMADIPEAVQVTGMVHGILFILYVLMLIQASIQYKWKFGVIVLAFLASLLPFGAFFLERIIKPKEA